MMETPIHEEATISNAEADLFRLIPEWVTSSRSLRLPIGISVNDAMRSARVLREQIAAGNPAGIDFFHQDDSADVLRGVCRSLMDDCLNSPRQVLQVASSLKDLLEPVQWVGDDLNEHAELLCTLSFCAWRATRILESAADSQRWEAEYLRLFRESLQWEITKGICESAPLWLVGDDESEFGSEPEPLFQILLYLGNSLETAPELVRRRTAEIHEFLRLCNRDRDPDLESFFLGESARILGCVAMTVGRCAEVEEWLERAEAHFIRGPNPTPQLARIKSTRSTLLYQLNRWDLVCQAAPYLDRRFAEFGMEEDRIKSRIRWAAALKLAGRLDEALEVLKPLRESRDRVPRRLYGWVLLQYGDIHQISGDDSLAVGELMEAAQLLREGGQFTGLAQISAYISVAFRSRGMLKEALRFLESSREDHQRLGMKGCEAYYRMLIAETYLAMSRAHDAEVQIRAAIPVFEEQGMVGDAVAAVSLLREAMRRQRLDPQPVTDIHERRLPKKP